MVAVGFARRAPHLFSGLIALAFVITILGGGRVAAGYLEKRTIHSTAPKDFFIKNQGLALQRAAARTPDVLLLYGSSELTDPVSNNASDFFSKAPSGFQVCPVGRPGVTSLIILQKLAALGSDLSGRKVGISISASWFFRPAINPYAYAGNFSLPAASALLFGSSVDSNLKKQIAKQMLRFPNTLSKSALLEVAANCLASGSLSDRVCFGAIWPLGKLQHAVIDLQDHFETLVYILAHINKASQRELPLINRQKTTRQKAARGWANEPDNLGPDPDASFRERIAAAEEWTDLELLFRTIRAIGAKPLVLSMPIDVTRLKATGLSPSTRQVYYDKVTSLAQQYRIPLVQFPDHDNDPAFLIPRREHPSPEGWIYYDRALDEFFHQG